ncbi:MAG TPA: hypothetical protein VNF29_03090, partial [Candidatus Binataceae bacterium]|nr:hypothetical protein [Candidatus Binataceae bacterium]
AGSSASDEIDYLDLIARSQNCRRVFRLRHDPSIDLDCDPLRAHLKPFDERGQTRVALDLIRLAVQADAECRFHHR